MVREKRKCESLSNSSAHQISEVQKKAKRLLDRETHKEALNTLNDMITKNNGVKGSHFIQDVALTYKISRQALYYQLKCQEKINSTAAGISSGSIHNNSTTTPNTDTTGTGTTGARSVEIALINTLNTTAMSQSSPGTAT